jgi:hypothetical protein
VVARRSASAPDVSLSAHAVSAFNAATWRV